MITRTQILSHYKHLKQFYGSDKEFEEHLFSGEVKIPLCEIGEIGKGKRSLFNAFLMDFPKKKVNR